MARRQHTPGLRSRFRRSLRARLVAMFLLFALAVALTFFAGTRALFSTGWHGVAQVLVADYVDRLAAEIGDPPSVERAQALVQRLPLTLAIDGPRVHWQSHPGLDRFEARDKWWSALLTRHTADGHRVQIGVRGWAGNEAQRPRTAVWLTLAGLLALTALAFGYVRHLFRPLDDIRAGALRFGAGDFSVPIPQRRRDELGDLAAQVNAMASNLQRMLEGQRGLLLAISHELRSPLTRARLNAELVADGPEREALLRDLGAMRDLIASLLESERLARGGGAALVTEPTDFNALVREGVAQQFADRGLALELAPGLPNLPIDRTRMQLLVRNLIDNALRHGGAEVPPPRLRSWQAGSLLNFSVRDFGPGLPEDQLARLAEPFFRPDAARTRAAGGVGLGLYLCRLVARSHGGELALRNAAPGLEAIVSLPLPAGPAAG